MRTSLLGAVALAALGTVGCGTTQTTFVKSDTTLGRVVVYRNGVAYFERYADVQGDSLKLNVPQDKVDDFLKSLTVVDAVTGEPAPISYPSNPTGGGTIDMKVGVGKPGAPGSSRRLRLSYVTEAPSWKPSYRVVVSKTGKVDLQGWAIVDNTSGEDWKDVKLGVGASSAMSFRFDLKGLRLVERETLRENDLFAQAPPMGGAAYGQQNGQAVNHRVVADVTDEATRFFVEQLAPTHLGAPGFVGAYPKEDVARVLRVLDAAPFADAAEKPIDDGLMRVLVAARGQMQCADIRAATPMSRGGTA